MSHGPYRFRESEMRRAIKATRSAGMEIARVEIAKDGAIVVVPGKPEVQTAAAVSDDLDHELAKFKARHGQG